MLCVVGLDLTIVGHYDFSQTGYYSIAILPTNFALMIMSAILSPLLPASSAMSTLQTPSAMGGLLARATRYSAILLLLTGLPLIVFGLPILSLWVGPSFAVNTVGYLRILVVANIIRNFCAPYATMVVATNRQGAALATAISEASVNLGASLYLASRYGAMGVAVGTLLGSLVSVSLHFLITMHFTQQSLAIARGRLFLGGIVQPLMIVLPSVALFSVGKAAQNLPKSILVVGWVLSTLVIAWYLCLSRLERAELIIMTKSVV